MKKPSISIIIPAKDEEDSLDILYQKIKGQLKKLGKTYEIIFVDDGSEDQTVLVCQRIRKKDKHVKIIKHRGNWGKSVALQNGFELSKGHIVFTMDADLQDDPAEIPNFLKKLEEGYDLVSGWKKIRHDPLSKTLPSKIGNWLTRKLTKVQIHDLNCGYKVYRREVVENLSLYGELYKYIPVLAAKQNFRIGELVVKHRKRKFGKSKFGWERNTKGLLDMMTVFFLTSYLKRPGHFFGTLGLLSFSMGFSIGLYITYLRVTTGGIQDRHPLLYFGMLLMIVGVQLVSTGLIAELITNYSQRRENLLVSIEKIFE